MGKKLIITFVLFIFIAILLIYFIKATKDENHVPNINYAKGLSNELSSLCKGIQNSEECASKIETYQLTKGIEGVTRNEKELIIGLPSGEKITFTDSKDDDVNGKWYHYQEYFPAFQYHLIQVQYYEGSGYIFLDAKSGQYAEIQDVPLISPDRKRIAIISRCDAFCDPGIVIMRIADRGIIKEYSLEPKEYWAEGKLQWTGNDNIIVTIEVPDAKKAKEGTYVEIEKSFSLYYGDNDWKVKGY